MPIVVTIMNAPASASNLDSTKTFDEQGGTFGRGKDNSWVLDDPERFLSSFHCQISCESGQFYLTDLSTNGTFINGAANPMGKGAKLALNDGNVFALGDYEFSVSINASMQEASADPFGSVLGDDIFGASSSGSDFEAADDSPFGGGHVSSSDSLFSTNTEETDPLAALDKAQGGSQAGPSSLDSVFSSPADPFQSTPNNPFSVPTHSDQATPLNQQISWPDAVPEKGDGGGIPDDWDDDLMSSPAPSPAAVQNKPPTQAATPPVNVTDNAAAMQAQQQANNRIQAELEILKQKFDSQQRGVQHANVSVDTRLIEAMGLQNKNLVDAEITQINVVVGDVMREMVSGLMKVLGSRSSIKNEFRMNVTTIQPVENNPLKFSANVDDALENMFIKQGNAYKKPVEAVKESFDSIAEHQVAILAGIRAAFNGVIERFNPELLEQRFAKHKKVGLIPSSQKAKNWESYLKYYEELAGDIDNSFQYLFGDEFVQAYEDQLQKLTMARKAQNNKTN